VRAPLVLAIILFLLLGSRHVATAGTVYGDYCPPTPLTTPSDAIGCRLLLLLGSADAATAELGRFSRSLSRVGDKAFDHFFAAQSFCSFGRTKSARQRLRRAKVLLDHYIARLTSPAAQEIATEVREPLVAEAVAIAAEVAAFRDHLDDCPADL
jgi:hypothetical protein